MGANGSIVATARCGIQHRMLTIVLRMTSQPSKSARLRLEHKALGRQGREGRVVCRAKNTIAYLSRATSRNRVTVNRKQAR